MSTTDNSHLSNVIPILRHPNRGRKNSNYLIGHQVWRLGKEKGFITPAELIEDRLNSKILKLLFMTIMVIFTIPYLTLQPIGAGYILDLWFSPCCANYRRFHTDHSDWQSLSSESLIKFFLTQRRKVAKERQRY